MVETGDIIQEKATVKDSCCQAITAQDVRVKDAAVCQIDADTAKLDHSLAGYVQADVIQVKNSAILIAHTDELRGDVTPVFTPVTAAVFGAAVGAGLFIINQLVGLVVRR